MKRLYPSVVRNRQDFTGVRRCTVPNQVMSIAEMFRRFVKREPLPAEKKAVYFESDYDLEKVAKMDRVDQDEVLSEMKEKTKVAKAKAEKAIKAKADKEAEALKQSIDPPKQQADPKA